MFENIVIPLIPGGTINGQLYRLETPSVSSDHMGKRSCHSLRIILKSSTAERSQNNHFIAARHSHIQDPGQAFLMQCLLLSSS